jgi:small subunit ribosomal protein S8
MSMTDPIADMLTRVRNAIRVRASTVDINGSRFVKSVVDVLRREGYVEDVRVAEGVVGRPMIRIYLKYDGDGNPVISSIGRISRPGRREYRGVTELPKVLNGLGIAVLSTSRGVFSDREARAAGVGGELLCEVW